MDGDIETKDLNLLSIQRHKTRSRRDTMDLLREWRDEEGHRDRISDRDLQDLLNKLHP